MEVSDDQSNMTVECPYAKSDMTPCVLRDGDVCYAESFPSGKPVCVACGRTPDQLGREWPRKWGMRP